MNFPKHRWAGMVLSGLAALALFPAHASHFRFGNLNWAPTANPGEIEFRLTMAIRRDDAFNGNFPGGIDQYAETGDVVTNELGAITFAFGDGAVTPTLPMVITAFSVTENWVLGEALDPATGQRGIRHTYPGPGPFVAGLDECCRVQGIDLNNRANGNYRIQTSVRPFSANRSPICSLFPIVFVPESAATLFTVPALDPDGDPLRFRLATENEAGGGPAPPNLAIDATTGIVTWNNLGLDTNRFWTAQVMVEDLAPTGGVKTITPVDFLLKVSTSGNLPPVCDIAPPGPVTVVAGTAVSFLVSGMDADVTDQLTLNTSGLPGGAVMTPSLPVSGSNRGVSSRFDWTPSLAQVGSYQVLFSLFDSAGRQTLCSVNLMVVPGGDLADLTLTKTALNPVVPPHAPVQFRLLARNMGPSNATAVVVTDMLPAGLGNVVASSSQGGCTVASGVVTCTLGALTAGQTATIDLSGTVAGPGSLLNAAEVSSSSPDHLPLNNHAVASVLVTNGPPTVSITRPDSGAVFSLTPGLVPIEADAVDPDGFVTRVEFFADGVSLGIVTNPPFHLLWQGGLVGPHVLTAIATDNYAATGTSAPVHITLRACDADLAVAPMPDQTRCLCDEVTFSAIVASPDPARFLWKANGVALPGQTNSSLTLRNLKPHQAGLYEVEVSTHCAVVVRSATLTLKGAGNLNPVSFTNAARIVIYDQNMATPYPAPLLVECVPGPVKHLSITLTELSHNYPDDIDLLLAGPAGAAVRLMSDAGGGDNVTNIVLTFNDSVTNLLPNSTLLRSGTYAPTDYETPLETFPLPAPGPVTATNFLPFLGSAANGPWSLFIRDDLGGDGGTIAGGWTLTIEWEDIPPALEAPEYLPDGSFRATLVGLPRMAHVIEASYDLVSWTPLSTNTLNGPLQLSFEPVPEAPPHCFFRAVRCP